MATIRATCETCGDIETTSRELTVRVCRDDNSASYQFRCPSCGSQVVKPAEPRVVEMLVASGVTLTTWSWPRELAEVHSGPPIDHDDLLDFHRLLQTDGWLETLSRTIRQ